MFRQDFSLRSRQWACGCSFFAMLAMPFAALSGETGKLENIAMKPANWQANGELTFSEQAGIAQGVMKVKKGGAILKDHLFQNGTIEYDVMEEADNEGIAGIWFHQQDQYVAENFYLRTDAGCPGSVECIQYAPVSRGNAQWDVYPEYQASAPVHASGWNHVKLVISGQRMNVYMNGESTPSLRVGRLESESRSGGIQLWGDAKFANLSVTPDATEGLAPDPVPDPIANDLNYVREWMVGPVGRISVGQEISALPKDYDRTTRQAISAERKGFVNLGRGFGTPVGDPDLAWLRATVYSNGKQTKHVALGWARQIWIFVNGKLIFADKNFYYPEAGRKPPLGRLSIENGGFDLPLQAGKNDIDIAISDDLHSAHHWGWGFEFRFDNLDGLAR
ncbi:hypothetical protein AAKU67_002283 [Oxalobacteraceae bacterium GrIS 2.11]